MKVKTNAYHFLDMPNVIEQYLLEKGCAYKEVNGQYNVKPAPCCGNPKSHHFYMNAQNGMWDCKVCGSKGNFDAFRKFYGDDPIVLPEIDVKVEPKEYKVLPFELTRSYGQQLWGTAVGGELLTYLKVERGLEEKTLQHFKIGSDQGQITIPIFDKNDTLTNIRRRRNPKETGDGPRYFSEKGCRSVMFNSSVLKKRPKEAYLTEGEFDAMQLWQRGIQNVVSVTLGAGYFSKEWADEFKDVARVYICFDNDEAGREGAKKAAKMIGADKCRIIDLPKPAGEKKHDLSDYFVKGKNTKDDFLDLANKSRMATAIDEDSIKHISDFNDELRRRILEGDYRGIPTGYPKLDAVIGGYRKGRVLILSGLPSVGKTTMAQNMVLNMSYRNLTTMYISMEMPPIDICKNFLRMHKRIEGEKLDAIDKETDPLMPTVDAGLAEFKGIAGKPGLPIYLYAEQGELSLQKLLDTARVAKESYGAQLLVIDHLHYFAHSTGNRASEVANIVRKIKNIAMDLDLPVLLLCHLNRSGRAQQKRGVYMPTLSDLKDSGAIEQDADQVLFVCRDSETHIEADTKKALVKVAKNRDGKAPGYVSFDFDKGIGFFSEASGMGYLEEMLKGAEGGKKMKDSSKTAIGEEVEIPEPLF